MIKTGSDCWLQRLLTSGLSLEVKVSIRSRKSSLFLGRIMIRSRSVFIPISVRSCNAHKFERAFKLYLKINRTSSLNNKVHRQKCLQEFMNETNWRAGGRYLLLRSSIYESSAWHCRWWPELVGWVAETAWNKIITVIIMTAQQLSSCTIAYHLWWQNHSETCWTIQALICCSMEDSNNAFCESVYSPCITNCQYPHGVSILYVKVPFSGFYVAYLDIYLP